MSDAEPSRESLLAEVDALRRKVAALEHHNGELARLAAQPRSGEGAESAAEAELRALFAAVNDIIMEVDRDTCCLKLAPTKPTWSNRITKDIVGKKIYESFPDAEAQLFLLRVREAIDEHKIMTLEHPKGGPDKDQHILVTISPLGSGTALAVFINITERRKAEEAQLKTIRQEEVIREQATALMELSTPLIPIHDDVVVMPLIGMLDTHRAQQVMTTLLSGIAERRARVAILDITGVSVVDTQVASCLLRAARAAGLLGSKVILTGMRPEVAQTLVALGADLGGITTRATLQSGIAYALGT